MERNVALMRIRFGDALVKRGGVLEAIGRGDDHHAEWFGIHEPESDAERFESQWHIIRHVRQWDGHFEIAYEACGRGFPRPRARHAANCMILLCVVSYTRFAEQTLGLWRSW